MLSRRTRIYAGIAVRIYTSSVTGFLLARCAGRVSLTATDGNVVTRRKFGQLILVTICTHSRGWTRPFAKTTRQDVVLNVKCWRDGRKLMSS